MTTNIAATTEEKIVTTTKRIEVWYEYSPGVKYTMEHGLKRISDPEDPRWDGELMGPPYNGDPRGYLQVAEVVRIDGEIVKTRGIKGEVCHKNKAQEFMRQFAALAASGSVTPWDQERHFRDAKEAALEAERRGDAKKAQEFNELLNKLVDKVSPSAGGHVKETKK